MNEYFNFIKNKFNKHEIVDIDKVIQLFEDTRLFLLYEYFNDHLEEVELMYLVERIKENFKFLLKDNISFDCYFSYLKNINIKQEINTYLDNDPSIHDEREIPLINNCFYAILSYRIAHFFYLNNQYLVSRIISEHAHSLTGIDINPGAEIGSSFFIDHGVGVVIGETSIIGNNVKIYHGVTLGALFVDKNQNKRHPTIEDNVILYANSSILGGNTIIGENTIVGSGVIITSSIEKNTIVKRLFNNYTIIKKHNHD